MADEQPDAPPMTWAALRDASAAVQLAVQMLAGPLAPWRDPAPDPDRVRDVLRTLEASARRVNAIVGALGRAGAATMAPPVASAVGPAAVSAAVPTQAAANTPPLPTPTRAQPPRPTGPRPARSRRVEPSLVAPIEIAASTHVLSLLRALEIDALGRGVHRLSIHAAVELHADAAADALLPVLVALVADAAAMGPADATVEVRAFADLADAIGDDMEVVFEVRPDPRVAHGSAFRRGATPGLPAGARVDVHGSGGRPRACLRVAAPPPARILAA